MMVWGKPQTAGEKALQTVLLPASVGYGAASYARLWAYSQRLLKQQRFPATVISIGNITCGGTGKTPVTIDLAKRLLSDGKRVAVLSRGYKRQSKDPVLVVSDGKGNIVSAEESGDEPNLIANSVPEAVVIVGSKRVETAPLAIEKFNCDTLLLDDGFQHLPIARDLDIVLLDYNDDLWTDKVLPAGRLREPISSLARADWVIITKVPKNPDFERLLRLRTFIARYAPQSQVSCCRMAANALVPYGCNDVTLGASSLNDVKVFAFSGIARPESFVEQLREHGANVVGEKHFSDHHWYTQADIDALRRAAEAADAELIVTTEKDCARLKPEMVKELPIAALRQQLEWLGPLPMLKETTRTQHAYMDETEIESSLAGN